MVEKITMKKTQELNSKATENNFMSNEKSITTLITIFQKKLV